MRLALLVATATLLCAPPVPATGLELTQVCMDYARLRVPGWREASFGRNGARAPLVDVDGDLLNGVCRAYMDYGRGDVLVLTLRCRDAHCHVVR